MREGAAAPSRMQIFDTHAHYDDHAFDEDRDELLSSFPKNGIARVLNACSNAESIGRTKTLTERYNFIYGAYGIHPDDLSGLSDELQEKIETLLSDEKCAAVGEVGLDYYHSKDNKKEQIRWFEYFIDAAKRHSLPLVIHSREAAEDTFETMRAAHAEEAGGVMHCYSYSKEMAKRFLDLGFYFGIGGVSTFKNAKKLHEAIGYLPSDRILLETDCPYLAPVPYRGKRNCSLYIPYAAGAVASIRGISAEEVCAAAWENSLRLFSKAAVPQQRKKGCLDD